jgi:hypothetical protein
MADKNLLNGSHTTALQYIRTIYLSLGAIIGLVCFVMGASGAVKLGLNYWFPVSNYVSYPTPYGSSPCDQQNIVATPDGKTTNTLPRTPAEIAACKKQMETDQIKSDRNEYNRQIAESIALTLVGFPVWMLHFWLIQADWKKRKNV